MNIKVLGLIGALAFAAPVAAVAAPAGALTAHSFVNLATQPAAASDAAVTPGGTTAKIDKVWWRGGWRGGWGWRRGFAWRGGYWRGPFVGFYGRPYWHRRWIY